MNQQLYTAYDTYLKDIRATYPDELQSKLSLPILMNVYDAYSQASKKIMIIGQETYKWYGQMNDLNFDTARIIECYKTFDFGADYRRSPFWKFVGLLNKTINGSSDKKSLLWTNLSRFDYSGGKVPHEITIQDIFGPELLKKEITITKPEIVVFTTFWRRDKYIKTAFPDLKISPVSGYTSKFLAKLEGAGLPINTFRTYHPNFLSRQKAPKPTIEDIIKGIVDNLDL